MIKIIPDSIRNTDTLPVKSISDIERIMNNQKKLRKTHITMLIVGLIMDAIEIGTVILWIARGLWLPFAIGMPFVILLGVLMVGMYYRNTAYICTKCNAHFKPKLRQFIFPNHTPQTRKLKCPACGHTGYCIETSANESDL